MYSGSFNARINHFFLVSHLKVALSCGATCSLYLSSKLFRLLHYLIEFYYNCVLFQKKILNGTKQHNIIHNIVVKRELFTGEVIHSTIFTPFFLISFLIDRPTGQIILKYFTSFAFDFSSFESRVYCSPTLLRPHLSYYTKYVVIVVV